MSDPTFAQSERRTYLVPILIACAALLIAGLIALHFFPATTVNIDHVATAVLPTHTIFPADSIVVGHDQAADVLFVAETVRIDNQLRDSIFLENFSLTFLNAQKQQVIVKALTTEELASAVLSFPRLAPMLAHPLLRETTIDPGKQAEGTLLFALQVPQSMYDQRTSAVVEVDLYHRTPVYQTIPVAGSSNHP